MALIIVESPTKARTFNRILQGKDYYVFATLGHIRDLPPQKIAVDYGKDFRPEYKIITKKNRVVKTIKELAKKNQEIILATDLDREGESIAYHVAYVLGLIKEKWPEIVVVPKHQTLKRIVFHEITQKALEEALKSPGMLRIPLIKAQQARRILDRIVGYELSPLLWKKTGKNWLSAGRVQTVALRLVVEREKEISQFQKQPYYQVYGWFNTGQSLRAKLVSHHDQPYEVETILTLFAGTYRYTKTTIDEATLASIVPELENDRYQVQSIEAKVEKRFPPPPLTTSLMQQEGFNRLGFSSRTVMRLAQDLYERGLITYHRTDSFNLSSQYVFRAKDYIASTYGSEYALEKPRGYRTKSKGAQEAHEAIRPTRVDRLSGAIGNQTITANHKKLYQLIWTRALATQMKEAEVKQSRLLIRSDKGYCFSSDHYQVIFPGFLKVLNPEYVTNHHDAFSVKSGTAINLEKIESKAMQTEPPPRYTEAALVKIMEEKGIGRPSTYAPIISLIQTKGYVEKDGRYFVPTNLGTSLCDYLSQAFPQLFEINFTAAMETALDEIASGEKELVNTLREFYQPFHKQLELNRQDTKKITIKEETEERCPKCGKPLTVRYSRYGKFYACSGYPQCKFVKPFLKIIPGKICPECGGNIVLRFTKTKRRFFGCSNYPTCKYSTWKLT